MTDRPACPPPPERRQLVHYRGRTRRPKARLTHQLVAAGLVDPRHVGRWPKARKKTTTTRYIHQGETAMQPTMIPADDNRPTTIEGCRLPQIPKDLTVDQATALLAEIWANDALPDHAKAKLAQQIDYRLAEAAGKGQQPHSVVAGVFFNGASPDQVMAGLKKMADQR